MDWTESCAVIIGESVMLMPHVLPPRNGLAGGAEALGEIVSGGDADVALEQRQQHLLHGVHVALLEALAAVVR